MFTAKKTNDAILLMPVTAMQLKKHLSQASPKIRNWLKQCDFNAQTGQLCLLPDGRGNIATVYLGIEDKQDSLAYANAALKLPAATYYLNSKCAQQCALSWALAQYKYTRYKKRETGTRVLLLNKQEKKECDAIVKAIFMARDLINTPAEDCGPAELADELKTLAETYDASFTEVVGEELIEKNYPAIYAVGKAAHKRPRLLELQWGAKKLPLVSLVGKGVCFDSGGLDIKPSSNMILMKKDMGGAAHVIGLASLIMAMNLPVRLHVVIPAVENAISGNAYRPGDIVTTRKGLTVEVGNTDAEGRLVLADGLTRASELKPKMIIDFATLTGAARVAVGTGIAAMFSNHDRLADSLIEGSDRTKDPVCRLPLFQPYLKLIQPEIADLSNTGSSPYGGAITAALFLEQFVTKNIPWAHFDIMAWNAASTPGKPKGGDTLGLLATYAMLKKRYAK